MESRAAGGTVQWRAGGGGARCRRGAGRFQLLLLLEGLQLGNGLLDLEKMKEKECVRTNVLQLDGKSCQGEVKERGKAMQRKPSDLHRSSRHGLSLADDDGGTPIAGGLLGGTIRAGRWGKA